MKVYQPMWNLRFEVIRGLSLGLYYYEVGEDEIADFEFFTVLDLIIFRIFFLKQRTSEE